MPTINWHAATIVGLLGRSSPSGDVAVRVLCRQLDRLLDQGKTIEPRQISGPSLKLLGKRDLLRRRAGVSRLDIRGMSQLAQASRLGHSNAVNHQLEITAKATTDKCAHIRHQQGCGPQVGMLDATDSGQRHTRDDAFSFSLYLGVY
ncbi:hypothetical protein [Methylobacterium sp. WL8]|uniref:hypothetical protein n=1 Tax=Methylobacterium sp. WL8 TaxID=2603899 RepID=UPI0011C8F2A1|nr:hypothetical protein [Methylobacterium sp. WL8]TXN76052.1 hypothetical protein FV234_24755 [Methylobacterium sp. WL8]